MHVLLVCVGTAGDVYPFIAIGKELQRRGHEVQILAPAPFRNKAERAGLDFLEGSTQDEFDAAVNEADIFHPWKSVRTLFRIVGETWPSSYAQLREHVRPGETILVAGVLGMAARLMQEKFGTKLATVHLAPAGISSAFDPASLASLGRVDLLPVWLLRVLMAAIEMAIVDPLIRPKLNAFRVSIGLPPIRKVLSRWMHSPQLVICAFPRWFAPPQPDWPPNTVCTTFPRLISDQDETMDPALRAFLDAGPPPIAFTPGSANAHGRVFFQRAIAASAALGMRAVLISPYKDQLPSALPPTVHHIDYIPYDLLAAKVAAFVHHGGIGTSATVLAAGIPQLITPFAFDQPDNAVRLKRLGVGEVVAPDAPAAKWVRALRRLLNQPAVKNACKEMAQRLALERSAPVQIAEWIEQLTQM